MKTDKFIITISTLIASTFFVVACQKGGGSDPAPPAVIVPPPLVGFGSCVGCPTNPVVLMAPKSQHIGGFHVQWKVYGEASQVAFAQQSGVNPQAGYVGIIAAEGQMIVSGPQYLGQCLIPPGTYLVSTLQGGQMSGRQFSLPALQAVGPIAFSMSFQGGTLDPNADGMMDRLEGQMYILQALGSPATQLPSTLPVVNNGLMNCTNPDGFYLN